MEKAGLFSIEGAPIPLSGVEVTGEVVGAHARVTVRQTYVCREPLPIEAIYTFPLPTNATLTAFRMTAGSRRVDGVVKEREQAFREYDDALAAGHGAALLEQERPNVFTAQVGNLLPNEETLIEIEYVEPLRADEGALRWMIPTLVAPRFIPGTHPGTPAGDRTAHGWAEPTDRVPDADRITPPISRNVGYGLKLDLTLELGADVVVESPSHAITTQREGVRTRVGLAQAEVALDRDVVLVARRADAGPLEMVALHRPADGPGYLALSVVPELDARGASVPQEVVFLVDVSGSMEGASITEARAALRLCLRHLREGDRFNVIAFSSSHSSFQPGLVPFTQKTLERADAWVEALQADGGTELLAPLLEAVKQAGPGVVVLLTDGQVGNEEEIATQVFATRVGTRIHPFGIGTNVSDALLVDLARRSGGAVEMIHPGERIDEKVVAQFARAIAPRVSGVEVRFSGVEVGELAPADAPPLVDGEPWVVYGRLESGTHGEAVITGRLDDKPFRLTIPIHAGESTSRPTLAKLWASERIRDLQHSQRTGRAATRMRERIVELATTFGVSSPYTAFVLVETRTGDRRSSGMPETRVVPVNVPAGWAMFERSRHEQRPLTRSGVVHSLPPGWGQTKAGIAAAELSGAASGGPPAPPEPMATAKRAFAAPSVMRPAAAKQQAKEKHEGAPADPIAALLTRQLSSGLWDDESLGGDARTRQLRATALALLELYRAGVTTSHALHGPQVKKAVRALLEAADGRGHDAELALGVAWLVSSGQRTRKEVEGAIEGAQLGGLRARLGDEGAMKTHVTALAAK